MQIRTDLLGWDADTSAHGGQFITLALVRQASRFTPSFPVSTQRCGNKGASSLGKPAPFLWQAGILVAPQQGNFS
jgi:hypothetical protein